MEILNMELQDRWRRGSPQRRFMDVLREDMRSVGVPEIV